MMTTPIKSLVVLAISWLTFFAIPFSVTISFALPSFAQQGTTSEQEALRNQWEAATHIAAKIRAQMNKMESSDPQYHKLKKRLETVEENARQLARKVPGTPEYEQEQRSKNGNASGNTREEARSQSSGWYSSEAGRAQRAYEEQIRRAQEEAFRKAQEQARESLESIQWLTELIATYGNWSRGIPEKYVKDAVPHIEKVARLGLPMAFNGRPSAHVIGFINIISGRGQGNQAVQDRRVRRLWTDAFINAVDPQILEKQFVYLAPIVNQYMLDRIGIFGGLSSEGKTEFIALARKMREPSQDLEYRKYAESLENTVNRMGAKTCNRAHGAPGSWFRFWQK